MFRISLMNVGREQVTKDINVPVDTLVEAEVIAVENCVKVLSSQNVYVRYIANLEYGVYDCSQIVGSFTITSLN